LPNLVCQYKTVGKFHQQFAKKQVAEFDIDLREQRENLVSSVSNRNLAEQMANVVIG
jgi:hypothetical protein